MKWNVTKLRGIKLVEARDVPVQLSNRVFSLDIKDTQTMNKEKFIVYFLYTFYKRFKIVTRSSPPLSE